MNPDEKIDIGWITSGTVYNEFATSVMNLLFFRRNIVDGFRSQTGPYIGVNRQRLVVQFLKNSKSDWLLMLDTDVIITFEDFDALMSVANKEKYPVLSGMYFFHFPSQEVAFKVNAQDENGWLTQYPKDTIVGNLHSVGAGYVLIHRSVFEKIQDDNPDVWAPWFWDGTDKIGAETSEDSYFSMQCKRSGIPIALYTGAKSRHIGKMAVTEEHFLNQ